MERDAKENEQELYLEVCQRRKDHMFLVRWHNPAFYVVPPAKRLIFYVPVFVFGIKTECLRLLCVPSPLCLTYYSGVLFGDNDCNTERF